MQGKEKKRLIVTLRVTMVTLWVTIMREAHACLLLFLLRKNKRSTRLSRAKHLGDNAFKIFDFNSKALDQGHLKGYFDCNLLPDKNVVFVRRVIMVTRRVTIKRFFSFPCMQGHLSGLFDLVRSTSMGRQA